MTKEVDSLIAFNFAVVTGCFARRTTPTTRRSVA